ncbi:hypothetical protein [Microbacterium halotolerans]|uniref:hypothetical protein n=1 Tax=Microbacterium halotolerans TaxID=246613 RepID=UPI000E6ABF08|nr:hypothetical protein [Microbacterium halotolerans]
MTGADLLHAGALALTGLGACCTAIGRPRPRVWELVLGVLSFLAMGDIVIWQSVAPVWWCTALIAGSLLSVVAAPGRRSLAGDERGARAMDALGGVVMGMLVLLMTDTSGQAPGAHSGHGVSAGALTTVVAGAAIAYAAACVLMAFRTSQRMPTAGRQATTVRLRRIAPLAMVASMLLMVAVVLS